MSNCSCTQPCCGETSSDEMTLTGESCCQRPKQPDNGVSADLQNYSAQQAALALYRATKAAYLRDVAAVEGDPCFFSAMGELHRDQQKGQA